MIIKNVPFFANTLDDTHCFQASLRMVLKYYLPDKNYSWTQLERITHKPPNKYTWPMAGLTYMKNKGFEVVQIVNFDYEKMSNEKHGYLQRTWTPAYYAHQIKNSDIDLAIDDAVKYSSQDIQVMRSPTLKDIEKLLRDGFLIICLINGGHYVVVYGLTRKYIHLHNPGLPPIENYVMLIADFFRAWQMGNDLMAFRKN